MNSLESRIVVSTFAGCGGSSLGWRQAGFRVAAAVEYDKYAAATYRANAEPETAVLERDIRTVRGSELLDEAERCSGRREIDVLDGSPPCQSWSTAGNRGLMDDPNGELFSEFVGLVEQTRPRVFVAENVTGLAMGYARIPFYRIWRQLKDAEYSVHTKILEGEWLGVPQTRHRVFILGFRADTSLDARNWFPDPRPRRTTIESALPHVARIVRIARPNATDANWQTEESWGAGDTAPTLTAGGLGNASLEHVRFETRDGEFRPPTVSELLALSTFPPDFEVTGPFRRQWKQLGNSVPPQMMQAVAERVATALSSLTT